MNNQLNFNHHFHLQDENELKKDINSIKWQFN